MNILVILTFLVASAVGTEPEVEIQDLFGDVLFQQGIPQSITCAVWDPLQFGFFTWKVGDRIIENSARVTDGEDGEKQQVLSYTPSLQDNGKKLTCNYGERGEQVYSDHINVNIYVMDLPSDTVNPGLVSEGEPITLELTAGLYPAPSPSDITWEITRPGGEVVAELVPGGRDSYGLYQAGDIQVLSDNTYKFTLDIAVVDKSEVSNQHTLTITTKGIKKKIEFFLSLKMQQEESMDNNTDEEDITKEGKDEEVKDEEPEGVVSMGLGLVIIIGIIVVFIICCIVYCIYRRKRKTKIKDSKTYVAVKTNTNTQGQPV